jgi:hypothetical protein
MGASFKKRISNFRERLKELNMSNEKRSEVESILDKLSSLRNERDKVAHSVWMPVFEDDQIALGKGSSLFKSWKNSKEHESSVVSEDKLGKIFDRIHGLFWEIVKISLDQEFRNANVAT